MATSLDDRNTLDGDELLDALAFLDGFEAQSDDVELSPLGDLDQLDTHEVSQMLGSIAHFAPEVAEPTTLNQESRAVVSSNRVNGVQLLKRTTREPNKARNKRREELLLLRKQVVQLELQLSKLQLKDRIGKITTTTASSALVTRFPQQEHVVRRRVWQEIARNQGDKRLDAERENVRLRVLLSRQLQVAKGLQKHLNRAAPSSAVDPGFPASLTRPASLAKRSDDDSALVERLLGGLEESYSEVDAVYATCGLVGMTSTRSHVTARMRSNGQHGNQSLELEIVGTKALPFDYDAVVRATWDHYVYGIERIQPMRVYYNKAPNVFLRSSEAYIKTHHVELITKSTSAHCSVKQVLRRFDEQDRVVCVGRSFYDLVEFGHERSPGVSFLEKAYVVIKKNHAESTAANPFTIIQTCHVLTPIFSGQWATSNENHPNLGAIADFVLAVASANLRATQQKIEDDLLQHAMAS